MGYNSYSTLIRLRPEKLKWLLRSMKLFVLFNDRRRQEERASHDGYLSHAFPDPPSFDPLNKNNIFVLISVHIGVERRAPLIPSPFVVQTDECLCCFEASLCA